MADEWIKMRGDLWTHPKFIALSNHLIFCEEDGANVGMLGYACGEDVIARDVYPPSNKTVTRLALQGVTKRALRDVTMCALIRVWCAVNAHCKIEGKDAVCCPMSLIDLDEIAGFDGFGDALAIVGWVYEYEPSGSLIFPNFVEYNEPAILRKKPAKTNAERQAEFRARSEEKTSVTKSNESNAREEKRREDIKDKTIVLPAASRFADFWKAWPKSPRKVGKAACEKKWKLAGLDEKADEVIAHVQSLAASKQWRDGFEPAPLTYLNQGRYHDADLEADHSLKPGTLLTDDMQIPDGWDFVWTKNNQKALYPAEFVDPSHSMHMDRVREAREEGRL